MARTPFQPKLEGNIKDPHDFFRKVWNVVTFTIVSSFGLFHGRFMERAIGVFTTLIGTFYVHHLFTSYQVHRSKDE